MNCEHWQACGPGGCCAAGVYLNPSLALCEHCLKNNLIATRKNAVNPQQGQPWPMILLPLKALAKTGDKGAGDIIARVIGPIGGDAFKAWHQKLFGKPCGCANRQEALNARWHL